MNTVTHSDCPLILPSQCTVPGPAQGTSLYTGLATGTGMGMGIWNYPDSWRPHATDADRKYYYFRPALGLAIDAIRIHTTLHVFVIINL